MGPTPRLVVHVGSRKAASTFVQQAIGLSEKRLAEAGVIVPLSGRFSMNPLNVNHHNLAFQLYESPRFEPEQGGWEELRAEIDRTDASVIFISCEDFEHIVTRHGLATRLLESLKGLGLPVSVVLVVRDTMSFLNSLYCQGVKMLSPQDSFEWFIDRNLGSGGADILGSWQPFLRDPDVELTVLSYDSLKNRNPLFAILAAGGVAVRESTLILPDELVNTSLGTVGVEVTETLRKYLEATDPDWSWYSEAGRRLHVENFLATNRRGWNKVSYWGWTPELVERHSVGIRAGLDEFALAVWGEKWPGDLRLDSHPQVARMEDFPPHLLRAALEHIRRMADRYFELKGGA